MTDLAEACALAVVIQKERPDLWRVCRDILKNAEHQRRWPDDVAFQEAGEKLGREISRQINDPGVP